MQKQSYSRWLNTTTTSLSSQTMLWLRLLSFIRHVWYLHDNSNLATMISSYMKHWKQTIQRSLLKLLCISFHSKLNNKRHSPLHIALHHGLGASVRVLVAEYPAAIGIQGLLAIQLSALECSRESITRKCRCSRCSFTSKSCLAFGANGLVHVHKHVSFADWYSVRSLYKAKWIRLVVISFCTRTFSATLY